MPGLLGTWVASLCQGWRRKGGRPCLRTGLPLLKTRVPGYCQKETPPPRPAPKIAPAATSVVNGTCRSHQAAPMLTGGWNLTAAAPGRSWGESRRVSQASGLGMRPESTLGSPRNGGRRQEAWTIATPGLGPSLLLNVLHAHAAQARGSALQLDQPLTPQGRQEHGLRRWG